MSKKLLKVMAILVVAFQLSALIAYGSTTTNSKDAAPKAAKKLDPITITWLSPLQAKDITTGIQNNDVFNEIKKRTGVTIDFTPNLNVSDANEKCSLLISSGDLPDLISTGYADNIKKIIKSKSAIVLDKLVKNYGPNMLKNIKKGLAVSKLLRSDSSRALYFIPDSTATGGAKDPLYPTTWFVRWDLYKKLGMPKVNTYDDLLKLYINMQKLEPTTKDGNKTYVYGFSFKDQYSHSQIQFPSSVLNGLYFATWESDVDIKTNKMVKRWTADPNNPTVKELRFLNKLYRNGLLDPDSVAMSQTAVEDKYTAGRYLAELGGDSATHQASFIALGEPKKGFVPLRLNNELNKNYMDIVNTLQGGGWISTCITTACKNPERVIKLIDYLCTPEGAVLQRYGIEGKQWEIKGGKGVIKDNVISAIKNDPDYYKKSGMAYAAGPIGFGNGYPGLQFMSPYGYKIKGVDAYFEGNPDLAQKNMTGVQKDYCNTMGYKVPADIFKDIPLYSFDPWACNIMTLPDDLTKKENKVVDYMDRTIPRLVFAKSDEEFNSVFSKFLSDLKALGADECDAYHVKDFENSNKNLQEILKSMK